MVGSRPAFRDRGFSNPFSGGWSDPRPGGGGDSPVGGPSKELPSGPGQSQEIPRMTVPQPVTDALKTLEQYFAGPDPGAVGPPPLPDLAPGHSVTVDQPFSVTTEVTTFGYNDPADNGLGFFTDPATHSAYRTNNTYLVGVSLPREILLSTFLKVDDWQKNPIASVWKEYAIDVRQYVLVNQPVVTMDSGGHTIAQMKIVDAGPTAQAGGTKRNGADVTEAAKRLLATGGKALATYMIHVGTVLIEIRGWDWAAKRIIGS